ncbi:FAD/NAD(P)-binding protein [Hyunsoonleella sp. 2307UL5-6]|uniref:FAD/NAD(P)-binding protein n=1 Tax=Hyunsoonleella sp. 2307UL5-6 TaxID=3384768 RepID=UPI0039BD351D
MKTLAIIGMGPRGLFALEQVLLHLGKTNTPLNIIVFEIHNNLGTGAAWSLNQPESNWVNITERALQDLKGRASFNFNTENIPSFPSYHEWCKFKLKSQEVDTFPPRRFIGKYLNERSNTLVNALKNYNTFKIINSLVNAINEDQKKLYLKTENAEIYEVDEVLLTIGHQSTNTSKEIKDWKAHTGSSKNSTIKTFENAYPVEQFSALKNTKNTVIGFRGHGLATIDVMRFLVNNTFGNFEVTDNDTFKTVYHSTNTQHIKLIPYSLNGDPLAPKPLNAEIDNWFKPTKHDLDTFESQIKNVADGYTEVTDISFLTTAFSKIAARIFINLKAKALPHSYTVTVIENQVLHWSNNDPINTDLSDNETSPYKRIENLIQMALGKQLVSLEYCIGQVWRHCQPTLYASFSHAKLNDDIIQQVIALDESTKRFSYGPPIESMQQVLALVDAKIMDLDFVNNPDIELVDNGWKLTNTSGDSITINSMINCVLDGPKLLDVNTPIITSLLQNDLIKPLHSELGIETQEDGRVISENGNILPIAVLGRLAKGSVIGVDAILECFGERITNWAKAFAKRHQH